MHLAQNAQTMERLEHRGHHAAGPCSADVPTTFAGGEPRRHAGGSSQRHTEGIPWQQKPRIVTASWGMQRTAPHPWQLLLVCQRYGKSTRGRMVPGSHMAYHRQRCTLATPMQVAVYPSNAPARTRHTPAMPMRLHRPTQHTAAQGQGIDMEPASV